MENINNLFLGIGLGLYGFYGIFLGLANKIYGKAYFDVFIIFTLLWVKLTKGEGEANRRKNKFKEESTAKLISTNYLIVGFSSLAVSIFILLDNIS